MDPVNGQPTDDEILTQHAAGSAPANPDPGPAAPASAPSAPAFNPQDWAYKFRDQTVTPKDRDEAIQLMQLGRSYRENKPKWEPILQGWESKKDVYRRYDDLSQALQANPQFRTELEQLAQKYSGQPSPQQEQPTSTLPPEVAQEIQALKAWREQQDQEKADRELQLELDAVEKSFPTYDWKSDTGEGNLRQRLIKFMASEGIYKPDRALKSMMYDEDLKRVQMDTRRQAEEDAARARKAGVTVPGTQGAPAATPQSFDHKGKSWEDVESAALESLGRR